MTHYADSSFLVSCYLLDTNTPLAKAYLSRTSAPLAWTALHALEVRNAFELGVFRGLLTTVEAASAWANLESDLKVGRLIRATVKWPAALRRATRLSERYSASSTHPCIDCGEADPIVLTFDHRDANTKAFALSNMVHRKFAWERILKEIEKCDVRCFNCHMKRTAKQLGRYKWIN